MNGLSKLVDKIQKSTGYEVFHHAIGRGDLNDFGDERSYIMAVHNIRNPAAKVGSPISTTLNIIVSHEHTAIDNLYNVVSYGQFPTEQKVEREEDVPVVGLVRRPGLFGLFLPKIERETGETERRLVTRYVWQTAPLSELVKTDDRSPAYFTRLTIPARIPDEGGRSGMYPSLTIISNQELCEGIIQHLQDSPQDYIPLLRAILKDQPKVRKGIIDRIEPTDTTYFVQRGKVNVGRLQELYGESKRERAYFEKVAVHKAVF